MRQFSRGLEKSYSNINANIAELSEDFNHSALSEVKRNLPSSREIDAAKRAATKAAQRTMMRHSRKYSKSTPTPRASELSRESDESPSSSTDQAEAVNEPMSVYIAKTTTALEELSAVAVDEAKLRRQEVEKADKRTRIGHIVSGSSLLLAALSLIFAIISALNPVTIRQPQQPIPVHVVDPVEDKPVQSPKGD